MPAVAFYWSESNDNTGEVKFPSPPDNSLNNVNFLSVDETSGVDPNNYINYPITVPGSGNSYSFEKWIQGYFDFAGSGSNQVTNGKFWKESGTLSHLDLVINAGVSASWSAPVDTASSVATSPVPTSVGSSLSLNLDVDGGNPQRTSTGYSYYIVIQLVVPSTVNVPGDIGTQQYRMQYDES